MVPHSCCADQIGIFSQRSQCQLRFLKWNEAATLANYFANAIEEEGRALQHAAAQNDHVRYEKIDKVGQAQSKVIGFLCNGLQRKFVSLLGEFTDLFCGGLRGIALIFRGALLKPGSHRGTSRQRFPTSVETTRT